MSNVNTKVTGAVQSVKEFNNKENTMFSITMKVVNDYRNKSGDYAGKYGSKFYDVKFFTKTDAQVKFVKYVIEPRSKKYDKVMTIEADVEPTSFEKNGETRYELQLVAQNFHLHN